MNPTWFDIIFKHENTGVVITVGSLLIIIVIIISVLWEQSRIERKDK